MKEKSKVRIYLDGKELVIQNGTWVIDPRDKLVRFLHKLGLKSHLVIVFDPINVLGRFEPVEIFPT